MTAFDEGSQLTSAGMKLELQHSAFYPLVGGQERRMHLLAREFVRRGVEVTVCTPGDRSPDTCAGAHAGVRVVVHPPLVWRKPVSLLEPLLYSQKLIHHLKREKRPAPDIVLCFHYAYAVAARHVWPEAWLTFLPGAAIWDWMSSLAGHRSAGARAVLVAKRVLGLYMERKALACANRTYVESQFLRSRLAHYHGSRADGVAMLAAPVDTERFRPCPAIRTEVRKELGLPGGAVLILGVGRLDANKNYSTAIRAAKVLQGTCHRLLIVGSGPEGERLQSVISHEGIGTEVQLIPFERRIERLYAAADIFVHPSKSESCGYVVLEAMSSALPCIVSGNDRVGISSELRDGDNALLVDSERSDDWADRIAYLLGRPDIAARIGRNARAFCEARPTWSDIADKLLKDADGCQCG